MKLPTFTLILGMIIAFLACKTTPDVDPIALENPSAITESTEESQSPAPGFGHSKARPQGMLFTYPAGIQVAGKPINEKECQNEAVVRKTMVGEGQLVHFCITFQCSH